MKHAFMDEYWSNCYFIMTQKKRKREVETYSHSETSRSSRKHKTRQRGISGVSGHERNDGWRNDYERKEGWYELVYILSMSQPLCNHLLDSLLSHCFSHVAPGSSKPSNRAIRSQTSGVNQYMLPTHNYSSNELNNPHPYSWLAWTGLLQNSYLTA